MNFFRNIVSQIVGKDDEIHGAFEPITRKTPFPPVEQVPDVVFDLRVAAESELHEAFAKLQESSFSGDYNRDAVNAVIQQYINSFQNWEPDESPPSRILSPRWLGGGHVAQGQQGGAPRTTAQWQEAAATAILGDGGVAGASMGGVVLGCRFGHPKDFITTLVKALQDVPSELAAGLRSDSSTLPALEQAGGVKLLEALSILTRSHHNRMVFAAQGGLQSLSKLLKVVVMHTNTLAAMLVVELGSAHAGVQLRFLQYLMTYLVAIVDNSIQGELRYLQSRMGRGGTDPELVTRALKPVVEEGILGHYIELLRVLTTLRQRDAASEVVKKLEEDVISTLLVTISCSSHAQQTFRNAGGLQVVVDMLGWPPGTTAQSLTADAARGGGISGSGGHRRCEEELHSQLRVLSLLGAAVARNKSSLRVAKEIGAFLKITQLLQWTAIAFTVNWNAVSKASPPPPPPSTTPPSDINPQASDPAPNPSSLDSAVMAPTPKPFSIPPMLAPDPQAPMSTSSTPLEQPNTPPPSPSPGLISENTSQSSLPSMEGASDSATHPLSSSSSSAIAPGTSTSQPTADLGSGSLPADAVGAQQDDLAGSGAGTEAGSRGSIQAGTQRYPSPELQSIFEVLVGWMRLTDDGAKQEEAVPLGAGVTDATSKEVIETILAAFLPTLLPSTAPHPPSHVDLHTTSVSLLSTHTPVLQLHVLALCSLLLRTRPSFVRWLRKLQLWEILYGPCFFFFGQSMLDREASAISMELLGTDASSLAVSHDQRGPSSTGDAADAAALDAEPEPDSVHSMLPMHRGMGPNAAAVIVDAGLVKTLQSEVVRLTESAASSRGSATNEPECTKLLQLLEESSTGDWSTLLLIAPAIDRLLWNIPEPTIQVCEKRDALSCLARSIQQQRRATEDFLPDDEGVSAHVPVILEARSAVLSVLTTLFELSESMRRTAVSSHMLITSLFELLWEKPLRQQALRLIISIMQLQPASDADKTAKALMFRQYIEALSRAKSYWRTRGLGLALDLLMSLHTIIKAERSVQQLLLRTADSLLQLVALLDEEYPPELGTPLMLQVLVTLQHLMAGGDSAKAKFKNDVGYDNLYQLLLRCSGEQQPSMDLLLAVMGLVLEAEYEPNSKTQVVMNPDAALLYFSLLRHCNLQLQCWGLALWHEQLQHSLANTAAAQQAGLNSLLVAWLADARSSPTLQEAIAKLLQITGAYSISGRDLRTILSLLKPREGKLPHHSALLLSMLRAMAKHQGPSTFFDFSTATAGIMRVDSMRWPSKGYTFCTWLRLESAAPGSTQSLYSLLHKRSGTLVGVAARIKDRQLGIRFVGEKKTQEVILSYNFEPHRWYHLAICHTAGNLALTAAQARVYVDGGLQANTKLKYPSKVDAMNSIKIASALHAHETGLHGPQSPFEVPVSYTGTVQIPLAAFSGQMGCLYLIEEALSPLQVRMLYSLGPEYQGSFAQVEYSPILSQVPAAASALLEGKDALGGRVLMAYCPQASAGRMLLDMAALSSKMSGQHLGTAEVLQGTSLCITCQLHHILDCLGGVKILLPLVAQLDMPVESPPRAPPPTAQQAPTDTSLKPPSSPQPPASRASDVLGLLCEVLRHSPSARQAWQQLGGFALLAHLLQQRQSHHLTVELLQVLHEMWRVVKGVQSLAPQLLEHLLTNLRLWSTAQPHVQRHHQAMLEELIREDPAAVQRVLTVPKVLAALRVYYWEVPAVDSLKQAGGGMVPAEEIRLLRRGLLRVLTVLACIPPSAQQTAGSHLVARDLQALAAFAADCADPRMQEDVMAELCALLEPSCPAQSAVVQQLAGQGGALLLLPLLKREQYALRVSGLRAVQLLLQAQAGNQHITAAILAALSSAFGGEEDKVAGLWAAVSDSVLMFPLTKELRHVLLDIMGPRPQRHPSPRNLMEPPPLRTIAVPQVMGTLCRLLLACDDRTERLSVLESLAALLEGSKQNLEAITMLPGWQEWLLDLLADGSPCNRPGSSGTPQAPPVRTQSAVQLQQLQQLQQIQQLQRQQKEQQPAPSGGMAAAIAAIAAIPRPSALRSVPLKDEVDDDAEVTEQNGAGSNAAISTASSAATSTVGAVAAEGMNTGTHDDSSSSSSSGDAPESGLASPGAREFGTVRADVPPDAKVEQGGGKVEGGGGKEGGQGGGRDERLPFEWAGPEAQRVRQLLRALHVHCVLHQQNGWKQLQRTACYIRKYSERQVLDGWGLVHDLLGDVVEAVVAREASANESWTLVSGLAVQPARSNVGEVLGLMDSLMTGVLVPPAPGLVIPSPGAMAWAHGTADPSDLSDDAWAAVGAAAPSPVIPPHLYTPSCWRLYRLAWSLVKALKAASENLPLPPKLQGVIARSGSVFHDGESRLRGILNIRDGAAVGSESFSNVVGEPMVQACIQDRLPRLTLRLLLLHLLHAPLQQLQQLTVDGRAELLPRMLEAQGPGGWDRAHLAVAAAIRTKNITHPRNSREKGASVAHSLKSPLSPRADGIESRYEAACRVVKVVVDALKGPLLQSRREVGQPPLPAGTTWDELSAGGAVMLDRVVRCAKMEVLYGYHMRQLVLEGGRALDAADEEAHRRDRRRQRAVGEASQQALMAVCTADRSWRGAVQAAVDEERQGQARRLKELLRALTSDRGVWASGQQGALHWKLDSREDRLRRRMKLKQNYRFVMYNDPPKGQALKPPPVDDVDVPPASPCINLGAAKGAFDDLADDEAGGEDASTKAASTTGGGGAASESGREDGSEEVVREGSPGMDGWAEEEVLPSSEQRDVYLQEQVLLSIPCQLISTKGALDGRLELTHQHLHFCGDMAQAANGAAGGASSGAQGGTDTPAARRRHKRWRLIQIKEIHHSRYLLQPSALELYLHDGSTELLNFDSKHAAKDMAYRVTELCPKVPFMDRARKAEAALKLQQRWLNHEISNFEYLMQLNTLACRTYNDLNQYPVLPWVLCDYESDTIDLNNPAVYRDLAKPVGVQSEKRRQFYITRYDQMKGDSEVPPFHYGSHYSSAGIVLYYLLRLEPFTALNRQLQGGRFDHADRLFGSIPATWRNVQESSADVKELTPEFFHLPDFLLNANSFNLGTKQDGTRLDNVALPPWARGSPDEFIRIQREALESDHVSDHLHLWVDLIFGARQRGKPAEEAVNVFHYFTYEGMVDMAGIQDPLQRAAVEDQIRHFGQTPVQLFKRRHPKRGAPPHPASRPLVHASESLRLLTVAAPGAGAVGGGLYPVARMAVTEGRVVVVTADRAVSCHRWISPKGDPGSFSFSAGGDSPYTMELDPLRPRALGAIGDAGVQASGHAYCIIPGSRIIASCGYWDNSLKLHQCDDGRLLQSIVQHKDIVTVLAASPCGSLLASGSRDTTVAIWALNPLAPRNKGGRPPLSTQPQHVLDGHNDEVVCLALSATLDLIVSASASGLLLLHTAARGEYVRQLQLPGHAPPACLLIAEEAGVIVAHSHHDLSIHLFTINGRHLVTEDCGEKLGAVQLSADGRLLITGGEKGTVTVRWLHSLQVLQRYEDWTGRAAITALTCTAEDCILAGAADNSVLLLAPDPRKLRNCTKRNLADV